MALMEKPTRTWDDLRAIAWDESFSLLKQVNEFRQEQESRVHGFVDQYVRPHLLYFCHTYDVEFKQRRFYQCLPNTEGMFELDFWIICTGAVEECRLLYVRKWDKYRAHSAYQKHVSRLMPLITEFRQLSAVLTIPVRIDQSTQKVLQDYLSDVLLSSIDSAESGSGSEQ